jgi:hypothetical protein
MLAIAKSLLVGRELLLDLMHGLIDAAVQVLSFMVSDEAILVLGSHDDFGTGPLGLVAIQNHLDNLDQIVEFGQLGDLLFRVLANRRRNIEMPPGNGYIHNALLTNFPSVLSRNLR